MNIKFLDKLSLRKEKEEFRVVQENIKKNSIVQGTNLWILFFAILIASLGLNINSTAVVIGAMLISPLIGPIIGLGFGAATNDLNLIRTAFGSYSFSTIVGLIASTVYFLSSPIDDAHSEILSRTLPSIYDVLIALFGGFAGVIAISSKQKGNVIPGVAIATAIMPPLCTAGYGLATLQLNYFIGAFYLFIINSVFIFAATIITTHFLKYPAKKYSDPTLEKKEKSITWIIIILTLIPSIYLGYSIVEKNKFIKKVELFISKEAIFKNDYLLKKEIIPEKKSILLTYGGREIKEIEINELKNKLKYYDLENVDLEIRFGFSFNSDEKGNDDLNQIGLALNQSCKENKLLKSKMDSVSNQYELSQKIYKELKILYPDIKEAIIKPIPINQDSSKNQKFTYLVILTQSKKINKNENEKLNKWLQERLGNTKVQLIFDY
jgi:uncharacterized hydrophobic protein (TIGR00271 family)